MTINVIGAGLAGCEAAWQIAERGFLVRLWEMRPEKLTPAHTTGDFAELVCSNSLGSQVESTAPGLLKLELERMGSLILQTAKEVQVPAGGALAVDRNLFARRVTERISAHPRITVVREEWTEIPEGITVIATGPLTSDPLTDVLQKMTDSENLHFYDAAAPIVDGATIHYQAGFWAARYGRGDADYFNCPMDKEEYEAFWEALVTAELAPVHGELEEDLAVFEGCMPIEVLAKRGKDAIRYGPFKPVGLAGPSGRRPYAVLQLRKENTKATLFNLVGCQTRLKWGEQRRVFRMIPALREAEFVRYGVMHRNTFVNSPEVLLPTFQMRHFTNVLLAGQLTGVEGYMESTASGLVAGVNAARLADGRKPLVLPEDTMTGALARYISSADPKHFQPMNANFGILPPFPERIRDKQARKVAYVDRATKSLETYLSAVEEN
ncbi:MAG TPA: FADH(2)-oxidizing methylenetetrahydrofolate--tRNA-(uracil(54)-C(5))-methyltransferase TrmFO [Firmicutes bacterium]|jgi:methylenetetrahydrofolate--tRNA-(uracil-5-)-methyltransferase|nr:MAG: tRNA (uracil-5-)-methyltransferase [Peptococcaceae bacterium 1109]HHT72452.1 FADH(2)-oxidizing methylenetetrahydrofolate--tRNA-(uracil(54)-C(5))-methyltransferase TrmFO [Bacillota bacterium]